MREIKFRGKRVDDAKWVYGYLVKTFTKKCFILTGDDEYFKENIWSINPKHEDFVTSSYYEVIPETVGQYTGLKDKDDKKIYEGDILKVRHYTPQNKDNVIWYENVKVKYLEHLAQFVTLDGYQRDNYIFNELSEVIGDIYENPQLLKREE